MDKTFSSVSSMMLGQLGPRNTDVSPGFFALVKGIRRSSSTVEQDEIVEKELDLLRQKLAQPNLGEKKMKELLVRLMYCEMLGHSASFGHITALKMAQQGSLHLKRVGYLAVSLFLHPNHELLLLLVNTVQKDLKSTNMLDNSMALTAVSNLFGPDMIPAIIHQVIEKLKHASAMVRKKAVMTLYSFFLKAPHLIHHMTDKFKEALCDREPTVMGAALHIYSRLITDNPNGHQSLVRPLVSILMQVTSHKLPLTFEFHGVPAPWIQIRILKMLATLGHNNEYASNLMYDVLEQMMHDISLRQMVSFVVHYECISTIASIYPSEELISSAAKSVSKFLKSKDNNLKYLGIEALGQLLTVDSKCGSNHQMIVVECLTDPDLTIRKKTLELLFLMANESNIEVICQKFLECLPTLSDTTNQQQLSDRVIQMAQKHYQSLHWFLTTVCDLCILADWLIENLVSISIDVIKKERQSHGSGISATVVNVFLPFASNETCNESLMQLTMWVMGEFASQDISSLMVDDAFQILLTMFNKQVADWSTETKLYFLSAIGKIFAKLENVDMSLKNNLKRLLNDSEPEVRQRAAELIVLSSSSVRIKKEMLYKEIQPGQCDWTLSFLDKFVSDALEAGAAPYKPKQHRTVEEPTTVHDVKPQLFSGLNFQPYSAPSTVSRHSSSSLATTPKQEDEKGSSVASGGSSEHSVSRDQSRPEGENSSRLKVSGMKKVWGKSGYIKGEKTKVRDDVTESSKEKPPPTSASSSSPPFKVSEPLSSPVQLNDTVATTNKDVGGWARNSFKREEENKAEEDPEMKQKKDLAQALFGNARQHMHKENLPKKSVADSQTVDLLIISNDSDVASVGKTSFNSHQPVLSAGGTSTDIISLDMLQKTHDGTAENAIESSQVNDNPSISLMDYPQVESGSLLDQISKDSAAFTDEGSHHIPREFQGYPSSKQFEQLCTDEMMRVTLGKVWKPKELVIVFFLYNKNAIHNITEVKVTASLPSSLKYTHTESRKHSMEVTSVNSQSSVSLYVSCTCPSPTLNMMISGEVTYRDQTKTTKRLFFSTALPVADILRPLHLNTDEFGRQWGEPCHDVRLQVQDITSNLNTLMDGLSSSLPFHIVELKGDEGLATISLLQSTNCLVHFKLQNPVMNIWIKSKRKILSDVVGEITVKALKEKR